MGDLQDYIIKYKKGELSAKEMHALEKKALSDPFLADALEGIENISSENLTNDTSKLNERILKSKKTILFTPLRIAAGVLLIATSVLVFYQLSPKHETIALKTEKQNAPLAAPKTEPLKSEGKTESKKPEVPKQEKKNALAFKATRHADKSVEVKKGEVNHDENSVELIQPAETTKPKAEEQLGVVETQASVGPEKKVEDSKDDAREQAPVSIAMEPVQQAAAEEKEDRKTERAAAKTKSARYSYDASSGAGVARKEQVKPRSISGKVISSEDGTPVPGVNVIVEGTTQGTVTDSNGNFSLQASPENQRLIFSFIGLQTQEVNVEGKDKVDVELKSDASQLSEVVVTGLGAQRDDGAEPVIHLANPAGGRRAYNKYLDSNVRYPDDALKNNIKGKVRVEFSVLPDGSISSYKVVKSLGHGCDEEVIRLINEGPKWSPTTENGQSVESKVRVGVRFDPAKAGR